MKKGLTLLEVIISLGMLAVIMSVVLPVMGWLITRSRQLEYENQAGVVMAAGMEVAYNVLLADWDKAVAGGTYQIGVELKSDGSREWTLVSGSGLVQSRFTRWVEVSQVCRDGQSGERKDCGQGTADVNSKLLKTSVKWMEKQTEKTIGSELLVVRL